MIIARTKLVQTRIIGVLYTVDLLVTRAAYERISAGGALQCGGN